MSPGLYVIIATSGGDSSFLKTLISLNECVKPASFKGLIVVENGSKNDVESIVSAPEFSDLKIVYLYSPVSSKSNALNVALRTLPKKEALIFFTDNDVTFHEAVMLSYSLAAETYGPGHFFGGSVERTSDSVIPETWKVPFLPLSVLGWDPQELVAPTFFLGCNWAAFKSDIESLRGFDMRYGPGSKHGAVGQEKDMQTRLIRAGCGSVYVKNAVVAHHVSTGSTSIKWMLERRIKAGVYFGISLIECHVKYDRSCASNTQLNVIGSNVELDGIERLKSKILGLLFTFAWCIGVSKGFLIRQRYKRDRDWNRV